ncbi:MAG: glycosyltransferase family 2 protein [Acetobacter sp.]|nr:glycosyltransferase family 2 protein [Acetobacter sp.]
MMYKIQQIVFPSIDIVCPENMYFRGNEEKVYASLNKKSIEIVRHGIAIFDTFFNSLSIRPWKENCQIDDLGLSLTGRGKVRIRLGLHVLDRADQWLYENDIELSDTPYEMDLPFWNRVHDGMLYLEVRALTDAEITGGYFFTRTKPRNKVRLGIVITHYNRKHYVLPAIHRISTELLNDPYYKDYIELIVVDNSQNIEDSEKENAILLPSKNLGGSGGFTRGLLYLKDENFTHCLFMDDDASCEMESIRRTLHILEYGKVDNLAVAGSMLREAEPFRLHEKGARIAGTGVVNLKHGLDMRHVHDLLVAETPEPVTYGGWWHFAFRIKDVTHLSFPFFVRGDDMLFGLTNHFNIMTLNGIGGWADDFGIKESPINRYLSLRAHLMCLIIGTNTSKWKMLRTSFGCVITSDMSYNYSGAQAFIEAVRDVLKGPSFWENNVDMANVRKHLSQIAPGEKCEPIHIPKDAEYGRGLHESRKRRFCRILTLNGFLLPNFLMKNKTLVESKNFHAVFRRVFRYKRILYITPDHTGYIAEYNKKKFFKNLRDWGKVSFAFCRKFQSTKTEYQKSLTHLTSEGFWRKVFTSNQNK